MTADGTDGPVILRSPEMLKPTLCTLIKTAEDRPRAEALLTEWLKSNPA